MSCGTLPDLPGLRQSLAAKDESIFRILHAVQELIAAVFSIFYGSNVSEVLTSDLCVMDLK